jgi:hypothetical protein
MSMDNDSIIYVVDNLAKRYPNRLLYFSNEHFSMDANNWDDKEIRGAVFTQGTIQPLSTIEELNQLSTLLERHLQLEFVDKHIVTKKYNKVVIDCIVGNDFIDNNYQDFLLARLLYYNSLNLDDIPIEINFYRCGATYQNVPVGHQYTTNVKFKIVK